MDYIRRFRAMRAGLKCWRIVLRYGFSAQSLALCGQRLSSHIGQYVRSFQIPYVDRQLRKQTVRYCQVLQRQVSLFCPSLLGPVFQVTCRVPYQSHYVECVVLLRRYNWDAAATRVDIISSYIPQYGLRTGSHITR